MSTPEPIINKYGLARPLPAEVAREVRAACGFGCVHCGFAIAQYDHFDPPFKECREHNAKGIALLCGHCHDKRSRGLLSAETVALDRLNPKTFQCGYARDFFDIRSPLALHIGSSILRNVSCIVKMHEGEEWFSMAPPETKGGPVRISARFFDSTGTLSLEIIDNEWRCFKDLWDTEVEGTMITVRQRKGELALQICSEPPHGLRIVKLRMQKGDLGVNIDTSGYITVSRGGGVTRLDVVTVESAEAVILL